jgi:hypothetical protein
MLQHGQHAGLLVQALLHAPVRGRVVGGCRVGDLDGHELACAALPGFEHLA